MTTPPDDTTDLRDRIAEEPIPCPVDHQCDPEESCGCWCDLHDVPIGECPTFVLVSSWCDSRDEELERLRAELAEAREDAKEQRRFHDALREEVRGWSPIKLMAQIEELQADLAEMTACRDSAVRASDRAEAELERTLAQAREHIGDALRRLEETEAERDALKAAIERAEALAAKYPAIGPAILAALDTPTDRDESGEGHA